MNTCKDCKFWVHQANVDNLIIPPKEMICNKISDAYTDGDDYIATTYGRYGDESALETKPDFGCNLFEQK